MKNILIFCSLMSLFNFAYPMENDGKKPEDIIKTKQINRSDGSIWINYERTQSGMYIAHIQRAIDYFALKNLKQMQEIETQDIQSNGINVTLNTTKPDRSTQQTWSYHTTQIARHIDTPYGTAPHISALLLEAGFNLPSQSKSSLLVIDDDRKIETNSEDDKTNPAFHIKISNDLTLPVLLTLVTDRDIIIGEKLLDLLDKQNKQVD